MNITDIIIVAIVLVLFVLSLLYIRKNGTCTENCESCHGVCHTPKKKQSTPAFVQAYRKDHPANH